MGFIPWQRCLFFHHMKLLELFCCPKNATRVQSIQSNPVIFISTTQRVSFV